MAAGEMNTSFLLEQPVATHFLAFKHHDRDGLGGFDVLERVAIDYEHGGVFAFFDGAETIGHVQSFGGVQGRGA